MITKENILETLKKIQDPELKRDIVSLGMVKEVLVQGGDMTVELTVAASSHTLKDALKATVEKSLSGLPGAGKVAVRFSALPSAKTPFQAQNALPGVQHVVAVASGKGGVGKTTVAVNLAVALARAGHRVGLMDGDIYGPNVPLMLGVDPAMRPKVSPEEKMIPIEAQGIRMISMGVLVPPDQPMVWRGPMLHSAVTQFLQKVDWGELDFLLVDLPPGTGDVQLSLVQSVPLAGAVIVTTPQEVALMDVRKGVAMFRKTEVPILGVVENMVGEIFGNGGGKKAAQQFQVPFLGEIPLEKSVREGGDAGKPVTVWNSGSAAAKGFTAAAEALLNSLKAVSQV